MLNLLLQVVTNSGVIGMIALFLAILWMLRDEKDRTRPLLVIALVVNLIYGWLLTFTMARENSLVPWKYDFVLARLDRSLGITAAPIAAVLQGWDRLPLLVLYHSMMPMMIVWFFVERARRLSAALIAAYVTEMIVGPALYAVVPACGPFYAFHNQWLHPPQVAPSLIRFTGMPNCFPSLHVATALVLVVFSGGRWSRAVALAFLACTALATISTGEHYIIDLVPGLSFGCFAAAAGLRRWVSSLSFFILVLLWSLMARFGAGFLIAHPGWLRAFAALTAGAAVVWVAHSWRVAARAGLSPANTGEQQIVHAT